MRSNPPHREPLVIAMVGLPARGKTYIARKLARYLVWRGVRAQVFNVGNYRRSRLGPRQTHEFFDPMNQAGVEARTGVALEALEDLVAWMKSGGGVAIYDATNGTRARRDLVRARCEAAGLPVLFVESVCHDEALIEANVRETKVSSPDYAGLDSETAALDFRRRIAQYEKAYETVTEDVSYVRIEDVGRHVVAHRLQGYLAGRLLALLMNLHIAPRPIWLTRHGQSTFNLEDRIGGDPPLTAAGQRYAKALRRFVDARADDALVWTSTLLRAVATGEALGRSVQRWRALDELDAGICDSLTYTEIRELHPAEYEARRADKLRYRYPRGESYEDVIARLDPIIVELERQRCPVVVVSHQAVNRALYAYFVGEPTSRVPTLEMPLHTLVSLVPKAYGCEEQRMVLGARGSLVPLRDTSSPPEVPT